MNRTLRFGEGLFETFVWKGENEKIRLHYNRLKGSAKNLGIPCPDYEEFVALIKANVPQGFERPYVKFILQSKGEGRYWERAQDYEVIVEVFERPPVPERVSLCFSSFRRHSQDPVCRHKTTSYLFNVLVKREAQRGGFYDGIILNEKGQITECSASNLLILKDGTLLTPSEKSGLLKGTTLNYLSRFFPIEEKCMMPEDLLESEGVFILNSLIGAVPVESVEGRALPVNESFYKDLNSALEDVL